MKFPRLLSFVSTLLLATLIADVAAFDVEEIPARLSKNATLSCDMTTPGANECFWIHGPMSLFTKSGTTNFGKYNVTLSTKSCQLTINRVDYGDDGIWTCFVLLNSNRRFRLRVFITPSSPTLSMEDGRNYDYDYRTRMSIIHLNKNLETKVQCRISRCFPQPEAMVWLVDGHPVQPQPEMEIVNPNGDEYGQIEATSSLSVPPSSSQLNKPRNVTCSVRHEAFEHQNAAVTARFAGRTTWMNVTHPDHDLFVGEAQTELTLFCESDGFPVQTNFYTWSPETLNKRLLVGEKPRLRVRVPGEYWCELNALYLPFKSEPVNVHQDAVPSNRIVAVVNSSVLLPCQVATGSHSCFWTHYDMTISNYHEEDDRYRIEGDPQTGSCNLLLKEITPKDGGTWICSFPGQRNQVYNVTVTDEEVYL